MKITIISPAFNGVQAWTLDIKPSEASEIFEKFDGRGESIILDADELPDDIKHYHK